jgi:hypothetical protein
VDLFGVSIKKEKPQKKSITTSKNIESKAQQKSKY